MLPIRNISYLSPMCCNFFFGIRATGNHPLGDGNPGADPEGCFGGRGIPGYE